MRCLAVMVLVAVLLHTPAPADTIDTKIGIVGIWASRLGETLWNLSEVFTKHNEIKREYKIKNASVKGKKGRTILDSSLRSVSTMLTRKINAVKCIHATAERLAREFDYNISSDVEFQKEFSYCDVKCSTFEDTTLDPPPKPKYTEEEENLNNFRNISLEKDSHFYNIAVNTSLSCVHVPTNIYFKEPMALNSILWSEELTDIFKQNYQSDPSLSWQYFGSAHGVLRFYPAMPWNPREPADTYDCRVRSWYIEAATCSKDVVILFDVSGSMTGFKNYVARITLGAILKTLSNNDYVNVFTFKNVTNEVIKCFDSLVQATPENINTITGFLEPINGTIHRVELEGFANLTSAYIKAFETLRDKRNKTQCDVGSTQGCNQMVMVLTDYVPANLSEVFEIHNREVVDDRVVTPVRVFTYLIGKDVNNIEHVKAMACSNRGFFAHIHSVEEVQQQVLKYINVIARPMILHGSNEDEPPPTWTHANLDETRTRRWNVSGDVDKPDEDKLVTSVAIPAFDYKENEERGEAILLGVAGTDVPIDSIAKLAQPHQLGVNGYSFIVSNNGYLLLHPLLLASINNNLQENYNSVDFVEVEQVDDGKGSRELGVDILKLREDLVNGVKSEMIGVKVLYHYDSMRRISRVKHDYFYNKLVGTPFSMGISLPEKYGNTELLLRDNPLEAIHGKDLLGVNVTDYFRYNYRVHPDWVYCRYHYLEGHETLHAEQEIWGFLVNMSRNNLDITKEQYSDEAEKFNATIHCGNGTRQLLDIESYYCIDDLVKQVVFDAKLTNEFFKHRKDYKMESEAMKLGVSVRFIATSSGLTRWDYILEDDKNEKVNDTGERHKDYEGSVFGDKYSKSIEETWYKAAVLQAMIDNTSLVIATNLPDLTVIDKSKRSILNEDGDITITASYAILYADDKITTPASVVGFQFSHSKFHDYFDDILAKNKHEELQCGDGYDCFLIDSSGYVILSVRHNDSNDVTEDVGKFFGAVSKENQLVLQYLLNASVFDTVEVFNYQALCPESMLKGSSAWSLTTPFRIASNFIKWLITEIVLLTYNWNDYAYAEEIDPDYIDLINKEIIVEDNAGKAGDVNGTVEAKDDDEKKTFSCDHAINLFILNQTTTSGTLKVYENEPGVCYPAFWASKVQRTNTLLVVVQVSGEAFEGCRTPPDTTPQATNSSTTSREPCHKLPLGALHRRRLEGCYTYDEKEANITQCGLGIAHRANWLVLATAMVAAAAMLS